MSSVKNLSVSASKNYSLNHWPYTKATNIYMNDQIIKLNLEAFAHGYDLFYEAVIELINDADKNDALVYIIPDDLSSQYYYSNEKRQGFSFVTFLKNNLLNKDREVFLSLFNEITPLVHKYSKKSSYDLKIINPRLKYITLMFSMLLEDVNNPSVFNVDFYYDKKDRCLKRKLDDITTVTINSNLDSLQEGNLKRYEECVAEFLSYKRELVSNGERVLFYNDSLNNLKRVVENALQNNFKNENGEAPKISNKVQISNILFDSKNPELEHTIDYVIKNIHHDSSGQPRKFTEKEYIYLWLELNKILYLLNRYKK